MSDQLSVALIDEQLKELVHWERLALHLEDIVYADIEIIKRENPLQVKNQRLALFDKWLHKCSKPTWNKLALALEKVDENRLAQQLRNYLKKQGSTMQNAMAPTIDKEITRKLAKLHETFVNIATDFKKQMSDLVQTKQVELQDVKTLTKEYKGVNIETIDDVTDIDTYLKVIFPHYHFLDCHLIVTIAKRFLNPSQILEDLHQHRKKVMDLKRSIKIKRLKQVLDSFVSKSPHETPVTVKVQDAWDEIELHAVEVLLQTMFRLPYSEVLKIFRVVPGSIIIVYLVPHHITQSLITHSQHKTEFMRLTGMIAVQVGETYVLREERNMEESQGEYSFEVALMEAVGTGNREAVTFLLEHMHTNVNTQTHPQSHTHDVLMTKFVFLSSFTARFISPLAIAYCTSNIDIMQLLLQHKANPDTPIDNNGVTVLHVASAMNNLVAVDVLLIAKANPDIQTNGGTTPLYVASQNGHLKVVKRLLQAKSNPDLPIDIGATPLLIASQKGYLEIVKILLQANANPNTSKDVGVTPLFIASQKGHLMIVERLLQAKANPDTKRDNGATPLYIASQNGHLLIVEKLLQANANPDALIESGATPLYIASQKGHLEIVDRLLRAKASNISRQDRATPLFIASAKGHSKIVERLLQANCNPNTQTGLGATPLFIASQEGHLEIVEKLLQSKANPKLSIHTGLTPLHIASNQGHLEVVKKLLQSKVSVNTPTYDGKMPLYIACLQGHLEVVKALLQANAVADIPYNNGLTPLFIASKQGYYKIVEELLQAKANPNVSNHLGETPLFIACKNGHVEVIKRLLQANADLNSPSLEGVTPLMIANRHNRIKVAELIEHHVISSFNDQQI